MDHRDWGLNQSSEATTRLFMAVTTVLRGRSLEDTILRMSYTLEAVTDIAGPLYASYTVLFLVEVTVDSR